MGLAQFARAGLLLFAAGAVLAGAAAPAAADVTLGPTVGGDPEVVSGDRAAHVVFQKDSKSVTYCRLPHFKQSCKYRQNFDPPTVKGSNLVCGNPQIATGGDTVRVFVGACGEATYVWMSKNGGKTFERDLFANVAVLDMVPTTADGKKGALIVGNDSDGQGRSVSRTQFTAYGAKPGGSAEQPQDDETERFAQVNTFKKKALLTYVNDGKLFSRTASLGSNLNSAGSWSSPTALPVPFDVSASRDVHVSRGPSGTFLLFRPSSAHKWLVNRFTGATFNVGAAVSTSAETGNFADMFEDGRGTVHVIWEEGGASDKILYRSAPNGQNFGNTTELIDVKTGGPSEIRIAVVKRRKIVVWVGGGNGPDGGVHAHWVAELNRVR